MSMNSVSYDIMQFLEANAFGTVGTDLFSFEWGFELGVGDAINEIDKQVLVLDQDPIPSTIKDEYENPVFLIRVRGNKTESGNVVYQRARDIFQFMIAQPRTTINGEDYVQFAPVDGIRRIGRDRNNRYVFDMSFFTYRNSIGDQP